MLSDATQENCDDKHEKLEFLSKELTCRNYNTCIESIDGFSSVRFRQLRQSQLGAGRHPGHERLPGRHEEAQGPFEALQDGGSDVLERASAVCRVCAGGNEVMRRLIRSMKSLVLLVLVLRCCNYRHVLRPLSYMVI